MKLEVPIKVDIDDVTKLIHDLQCLQTYKLGVNDTTVLVSLDAVDDVFADHIRAKRLDKDTNVPTKWIPVSERLPEEYCECLATYETIDGRKFLDILEYEPSYEFDHENYRFKGDWLFNDDDSRFTDGKVVAWMPLPEPYKEGEQHDSD